MMRKQKQFPLVADGETIIGDNPVMHLYEETDLISNIKGPYQEKEFGSRILPQAQQEQSVEPNLEADLLPPLFEPNPSNYSRRERKQKPARENLIYGKTQGQQAREEAREDIKKKRSAAYLRDDKPQPAKVIKREPVHSKDDLPPTTTSSLGHLADRLRQETYILADLPAVYSLKKEDREEGTAIKKNSYDFLKKSQVYNYPERKVQRERQVAQELNLTHIEEEI